MRLSENLTLSEMLASNTAKRKGIDNSPSRDVHIANMKLIAINIFQPIRDYFCTPIFISSGYRSSKLNKALGGSSSTSQHMSGQAIDIDADRYGGVTNSELFNFIKDNLDFDQLIWEYGNDNQPDWVHVSYKNKGNRGQILKVDRVHGKPKYSVY